VVTIGGFAPERKSRSSPRPRSHSKPSLSTMEPDLTQTMIDGDEEPDADYEQAFPARLHYLLDVLEKDGLAHVCSFQSHGRAFVVRDKDAFVKDILPK
jgi:hypothetical protein